MADLLLRGVTVHYQTLGRRPDGPLVVFAHGLVMDNLSSWYFTAAGASAALCETVVYDLRGHGRSSRPASGYGVGELASDLEALVDAVAPGRPLVLVGNSFGGVVALEVAARRPEQVVGLLLVDAHVGDAGLGEEMEATLSLEGEARDQKIAESFQSWIGRHSDTRRTRLADRARQLVFETSLVSDVRRDAGVAPERLAAIRAPVRLIYGERSDVRERAEALAALLPDAQLEVVAGAGHAVLWEATDRIKAVVVALLETVLARGTA